MLLAAYDVAVAGKISLRVARRQGAAEPCTECDDNPDRVNWPRAIAVAKAALFDMEAKHDALAEREAARYADQYGDEEDEFAYGPGWVTNPRATRRLMNYWSHGRGAAKIRWFTKGSMRRCIRRLRKYFPQNAGGLCANLHHEATGEWPRGGVIPS